jgi:hypothetical protein
MLNKSPDTVKKFCTNWLLSWDKTEKTPGSFQRLANDKANPGKTRVETMPAKTLGNPTRNNVRIWTRFLGKFCSLDNGLFRCHNKASRIPPPSLDDVPFLALLSFSVLLLLLSSLYVDRTYVISRAERTLDLRKLFRGCIRVNAWEIEQLWGKVVEERNATASQRRIVAMKNRSILRDGCCDVVRQLAVYNAYGF